MSLLKKRSPATRIDAKRVAEIIGCAENTVYNRGAGTANLTRIKSGGILRFIEEEVTALALEQETRAHGLKRRHNRGQSSELSI